jgi:hypothetical protein
MRSAPVVAVLMMISLGACRSTTHVAPVPKPAAGLEGDYAAPGLPTQAILTASEENRHVYTSEEISALIKRPESVLDLLKNMKIAWDRKLLAQQEFWPTAALLRFLNADRLEWQPLYLNGPPAFPPESELTHNSGYVTVHGQLLPTPISVHRSHYKNPAETAPWVYPYPAHTESVGILWFNVAGSGITWGVPRELFGPGYINKGPPPPPTDDTWPGQYDAATHVYQVSERRSQPQPGASADFSVCYESPEGVPPVFNSTPGGDEICFGLKAGSKPLLEWHNGYKVRDPEDDDVLIYVNTQQHFGHIPSPCYVLKLDPSLEAWCPARKSQS